MTLSAHTIVQAHQGLVDKSFSAVELAEACLAQISNHDEKLNVYLTVTKDEALASAKKVDEKIANGESIGMLEGIPVAVKDLFNTKGVRTTCASNGLRDFVPPYDATSISMLRDKGMVMLGKTNLDEHACGASTENSFYGVTKNPWDLECVAGGSSGGSAAAVSADMCIYSIGTDTGGSIRQPGALCSVPALKVTYGRVSRFGVTAMASSWDTIGPFAKTVEDLAIVLNGIAGHDPYDATTPKVDVPDYRALLTGDVKGLRVGVPKEYFGEGVEDEVRESVMASIKHLEGLGAEIKEISLPMTKYAISVYYITMPAELSANLSRFDGIRFGSKPTEEPKDLVDYYYKQRGEAFGDEIKRRIMMGTYVLSAGYFDAYYTKAQKVRTKIIEDFDNAFKEVDVICGPVSPFPAFKIGAKADDPLAMYLADAMTIPASAAGLPALSLPCGFSKDGLPIGLQVIGPMFEEGRILNVGHAFEQSTEWHAKRPTAFL
jgi:aspartyl-tRNA(Asn)/glutamyl-tRNA(Gln) amidotransferase subunit A